VLAAGGDQGPPPVSGGFWPVEPPRRRWGVEGAAGHEVGDVGVVGVVVLAGQFLLLLRTSMPTEDVVKVSNERVSELGFLSVVDAVT
jgi:hypothetical protein